MDTMALDKGWIDIHAHILPGVDDGAGSWDEAVVLLNMAYKQGVRHIIATPHYRHWQDMDLLKHICMHLDKRAGAISKDYHVSLGQEIMYFENLPEYLDKGKALTMAGGRYVLVEFEPMDSFGRIERAVRQLVQASYFPVVAHAERYKCLAKEGLAEELVDCGAYLQMNSRSLKGRYRDERVRWCKRKLRNGVIHFLTTDMHNVRVRPPDIEDTILWIERHIGRETAARIALENPEYILSDRML